MDKSAPPAQLHAPPAQRGLFMFGKSFLTPGIHLQRRGFIGVNGARDYHGTCDLCDLCICEALPSAHRHAVRAEPGGSQVRLD